jgi:hypothetical protein
MSLVVRTLSCPSNIMYHTFTFFPSIRRLLSHFQSVTAARLAAWSDNEIMNIMSRLSSSSSTGRRLIHVIERAILVTAQRERGG